MPPGLIGRASELQELTTRLRHAATGDGGLVLLSGEAGVGKTRLANELVGGAGVTVLRGRATPGGTAPYAPLVAALRGYLHERPDGLAACGPLRRHLAQLLPELGEAVPGDRATLFEALRCAFAAAAPALIVLEDLQCSDEATLELLGALAEPLSTLPLLVLATYRSDGLPRGHGLRRLRHELRRAGHLDELTLRELEPEDTAALLAELLDGAPAPSLVALVHDRTAGVPFFIEELAGALPVTGALRAGPDGLELAMPADVPVPDSVREAVLVRAAELPSPGRRAAEVAAAAGDDVDLDIVAEVAGDAGLAQLLDSGLVTEDEGRGRFRHALVRDALYADLPWTARRRLHAELAAALERHGAASRDVAVQWLGARDDDRARAALQSAAAESEAVYAYRDAAEAGRQALELWAEDADVAGRVATLERYARCSQLAGELGEAARAWRELALAADGDSHVGAAQRSLAGVHALRGDTAGAVEAHLAAAAAFAAAGRVADAVVERLAVADRRQYAARHAEAIALAVAAERDAQDLGRIDLRVRAMGVHGLSRAKSEDYDDGLELVRGALAIALEHGLTDAAAALYQTLSVTLYQSADYGQAQAALSTAIELCDATHDAGVLGACMSCLAYVLLERGEWADGATLCRDLIAADGGNWVADGLLGAMCAAEGKLTTARRLLTAGLAAAEQRDHYNMTVVCVSALARIAATEGEVDEATDRCEALLALWARSQDRHYAVAGLRWASTFLAAQHDAPGAHACADALARIAASTGHPDALAALAHAIGECALLQGDAGTAVQQLTRALALHEDIDMPFERAQIGLRAGEALGGAGDRDRALEVLTEAYRTARRLGARPLAAQIAQAVEGLGAPASAQLGARATASVDATGLSRREREVLRLVTGGRTNREIAAELVLSQRTVDMHVRNILRKLDCRSRVEAAVRARELDLVG